VGISLKQSQASSAPVDSAPGHQETLKPPSGGFLYGLAELNGIQDFSDLDKIKANKEALCHLSELI
jgi:hypothetical protein